MPRLRAQRLFLAAGWPSAGDGRVLSGSRSFCVAVDPAHHRARDPTELPLDRCLSLYLGRERAGRGHQPLSLHSRRSGAGFASRRGDLPAHQPALYGADDLCRPSRKSSFFAITRFGESVTAMRLGMLGFEAIAVLALAVLLRRRGLPLASPRALSLASAPGLGIRLRRPCRRGACSRRRSSRSSPRCRTGERLSGALLAAATLTKFLPARHRARSLSTLGLEHAGGLPRRGRLLYAALPFGRRRVESARLPAELRRRRKA